MANPSWSKAKYAARGVHLDQDTAGRLLESMSDCARREMIVRIARAVRQNPAYRPFATDVTTSGQLSSEVVSVYRQHLDQNRLTTMRPIYQLLVVPFLAGCASTQIPRTGTPTAMPSAPAPTAAATASWTFRFAPGNVIYRISRSAAIENLADSSRHEITTNSTHESVSLSPSIDSIAFTAVVDTFLTTTQRTIGAAQSVQLPLQVTGVLVGDSLTVLPDSLSEGCSPVTTALITDLHNLLPRLPTTLSAGASWADSTNATGCQGSIPTTSHTSRSFRVIGESRYEAIPVLVVQRADTIHAEGEGAQLQHRLQLKASGVGNATYYMDAGSGRIVRLTVSQDLNLTITASGKPSYFRQTAKEEFTLVR